MSEVNGKVGNCVRFLHQGKELEGPCKTQVTANNRECHYSILLPLTGIFQPTEILYICDGKIRSGHSLLFSNKDFVSELKEPKFKIITDTETPSGNASFLNVEVTGVTEVTETSNDALSSTQLSSLGAEAQRPEPNLSAIDISQKVTLISNNISKLYIIEKTKNNNKKFF